MTFLFAYLGSFGSPPGWPIRLIYLSEAAFVTVALSCILLAGIARRGRLPLNRDVIAGIGGVSASFGLIMPFELAPFFFHVSGEAMLGTILLNLAYGPAAVLFVLLLKRYTTGAQHGVAG